MTSQTWSLCGSTRLNQMRWDWIHMERRKLMEKFRFYRQQWLEEVKGQEEVRLFNQFNWIANIVQ